MKATVSLIVTTYEWPQALELALRGIARQTVLPDEVIVADDGSGQDTRALIERIAREFPTALRHVWQEHRGFRVGEMRNRAVAASRGEYVIFLDGDMVPQRDFIADHLAVARARCFTQGTRSLAGSELTGQMLAQGRIDVSPFVANLRRRGHAFRLPIARFSYRMRNYGKKRVMSCNQGFWRSDFLALNGFDERMAGWGREDTELAVRAYHAGMRRIQMRGTALAVHLHHPPRGNGDMANPNDDYLAETENSRRIRCEDGVDKHTHEYRQQPPDLRHAPELPACA